MQPLDALLPQVIDETRKERGLLSGCDNKVLIVADLNISDKCRFCSLSAKRRNPD